MRVHERFRYRGAEPRGRFRRNAYDDEDNFPRRRCSQGRYQNRMGDYYEEDQRSNRRWEEGVEEDFRDERGYERAAQGFYTNDPPSANSAVVETVFRKPKVYADLHEYDDGAPMIDRVPTAIGYHSMDSAEEYAEEKSRASRYSYDVRDDGDMKVTEDEAEPPVEKVPSTDPDDGDKYSQYLQGTQDHAESTMRTMWSEDSDSCPPVWKSFSEEKEEATAEWALAQAKRRAALNSVSMPKKGPPRSAKGRRSQPGMQRQTDPNRDSHESEQEIGKSFSRGSRGSRGSRASRGSRGSREDSLEDDAVENKPKNVPNKSKNGSSKKGGKKKWEAWGYVFNGGGGSVKSGKSKKSNDSSHETKSKSTKSKGSRHTRESLSKKSQPFAEKKKQPNQTKSFPPNRTNATRNAQEEPKAEPPASRPIANAEPTRRPTENSERSRKSSSSPAPSSKKTTATSKTNNRGDLPVPDKIEIRPEEPNEEKSGRSTRTGGQRSNRSKPRDMAMEGSQAQTHSTAKNSQPQDEQKLKTGISNKDHQTQTHSSKGTGTKSREVTEVSTLEPSVAPPIPLVVDLPNSSMHGAQPVDNDEFIMQVRGEDPKSNPQEEPLRLDKTEPKDPNKFDGFASFLMSGFEGLANLGLNEPLSFLDWSGEEKEIEKLTKAASSESKKKPKQRTDAEGVVHLDHPKNAARVTRESASLTLDGSLRSERRSLKHSQSNHSRRSLDRRNQDDEEISVYEERRSGREERDSHGGYTDERSGGISREGSRQAASRSSGSHHLRSHEGYGEMLRLSPLQPVRKQSLTAASRGSREQDSRQPSKLTSMKEVSSRHSRTTNSRTSRDSKEVQSLHLDGQEGVIAAPPVTRPLKPASEARESPSTVKDVISITTIEFPTPEYIVHEEDDGSISILGLERKRSHSKTPSSTPSALETYRETQEPKMPGSKSGNHSRASSRSLKKGKSSFLGKFLARQKA